MMEQKKTSQSFSKLEIGDAKIRREHLEDERESSFWIFYQIFSSFNTVGNKNRNIHTGINDDRRIIKKQKKFSALNYKLFIGENDNINVWCHILIS